MADLGQVSPLSGCFKYVEEGLWPEGMLGSKG